MTPLTDLWLWARENTDAYEFIVRAALNLTGC